MTVAQSRASGFGITKVFGKGYAGRVPHELAAEGINGLAHDQPAFFDVAAWIIMGRETAPRTGLADGNVACFGNRHRP